MFDNDCYCDKIAFSDDYNIDFKKSFPILDDSDITSRSNTSYTLIGILWGHQINLNPDISLKIHDILIERPNITKKKISWVATKPSKAF